MIKFVIKNEGLYKQLQSIPFVRKFFVFDLSHLNQVQDDQLFDAIFSSISNPNGTSKTTADKRLKELDEWMLPLIPDRPYRVHDVAVSSGITSLDLYQKLKTQKNCSSFHISDKYAQVRYKGKTIKRFYDTGGKCMFLYVWGLYAIKQTSWIFFLSKILYDLFKTPLENYDTEVWLLHPEVVKKIDTKEWVFEDYDVFDTAISERFDLVRCMNLLNPIQFTDNQMKTAIENIKHSLVNNGFLLLGRTTMSSNTHRASLLKKVNNEFVVLKDINGGSELLHLI